MYRSRESVSILCSAALLSLLAAGAGARPIPYEAALNVATGISRPNSLVADDLDGDGDLDLVAAAFDGNRITWYENDGTPAVGGWTPRDIATVVSGASSVAVADVDGDGDRDVVCAAYLAGDVLWYENDGTPLDGGWTSHTIDGSASGAISACAADIDGDGDPDVLVAAYDANQFIIYENSGAGPPAWTKHAFSNVASGAVSVCAADLDRDGDLDLVGATQNADDVLWYQNDGTLNLANWTLWTVDGSFDGVQSVTTADVDGDGYLDVLAAAVNADDVVWYENDGTPAGNGWTKRTIDPLLDGASAAVPADLDGDGDVDVLAAGQIANDVTWYENDGAGPPGWTRHTIDGTASGALAVVAEDLDRDGDMDLMAACAGAGTIVWYRNVTIHRSATFSPGHGVAPSLNAVPACATGDMDGDGDLDVVAADYSLNQVSWHENVSGDGSAWTTRILSNSVAGAYSVSTADVDGDGDLDVLCAARVAADVIWFENDGTPLDGGWTLRTIDGAENGATSVCAADIDGDGDQDVMVAAYDADQFVIYQNNGAYPPAWTKRVFTGGDGAVSVCAADLDRDGDLDLVGATQNAGDVVWYQNDGTLNVINWTLRTIDGSFDGVQSVTAADVDGDGYLDVLAAAVNADAVAWYENDGTPDNGGWTKRTIDPSLDGASAAVATDLDGDGDVDVLAAGQLAGDVAWYESDGATPPGWTSHTIDGGFSGAVFVVAGDLDGDGDTDVLGSALSAGDPLNWFANQGGQFALATTSTAPSAIAQGQQDDVLKIDAIHRGRAGDGDLELATLELRFEESPGDPLTSAEANALIANLYVYRDDGSGVFESGSDLPVAIVSTLSLIAGQQTVSFTDGDPNVQVTQGTSRSYFVVPELTGNAASQVPDSFLVTHVTESSSIAEDRSYDFRLSLEAAPNVASTIMQASATSAVDPDVEPGFWMTSANPSVGRVDFAFALRNTARVKLGLFDLAGREVARLAEGVYPPGMHHAPWNAGGSAGPSGVLFARYETKGLTITRRVVRLR